MKHYAIKKNGIIKIILLFLNIFFSKFLIFILFFLDVVLQHLADFILSSDNVLQRIITVNTKSTKSFMILFLIF